MTLPLPDYKNLDISGDALQAAQRMDARASEVASQELFEHLVMPLLADGVKAILEFGCGTAALSRRMARVAPQAQIFASDKSKTMLEVAQRHINNEHLDNIRLQPWDVLDKDDFPFPTTQFDLIISSVVIPYFDDAQVAVLIERLSCHLAPGGVLAFIEQDLTTDTVNFPRPGFFRDVLTGHLRKVMRPSPLPLRSTLRDAGLQVLPRRSYLWTDDAYGPYTRDLLERFAEAACDRGQISPEERDDWKKTLDDLAAAGDFYYGMVYHLVAGKCLDDIEY
jgi:SAM-dependent methyltransferase